VNFNIAICKLFGFGCTKNLEDSFDLFKQIAKQDHVFSQYYLAICYKNGFGCNKNPKKAISYLKKAANVNDLKNGNPKAQYYLGKYYEKKNDLQNALKFYEEAANKGYRKAKIAKEKLI
jgi:TPR repeat protein